MKSFNVFLLLPALVAVVFTSCGEAGNDDQAGHSHGDHDHGPVAKNVRQAGPNGGRILHKVEPHLEFLITADRKVQLTALDDAMKPIAMGNQAIRVTGGDRANPIKVNLVKNGNTMFADASLPAGDDFPIVVQVTPEGADSAIFEKFTLNMSPCPTCDYLEYACTCDHGEVAEHDHDHKH